MFKGTIYNVNTGLIVSSMVSSTEEAITLQLTLNPDHRVYMGQEFNNDLHYFVDGVPVSKLRMPLTINGEIYDHSGEELQFHPGDTVKIEGIPNGAQVIYPGGSLIVDDGFIEWSTDESNFFSFVIEAQPYMREIIYANFVQA
jgi:hypothetical protein